MYKGFKFCLLSHNCHFDMDRDVWTAHCRSPSGKSVHLLSWTICTGKNPKFGKVRQVPTREFPTKFPDWTCLTLPNLGFLWVFFKYPKISKNGDLLFFSCVVPQWLLVIGVLQTLLMVGGFRSKALLVL